MKVNASVELMLVAVVVAVCSIVAIGLLLQHLWPIALLVFIAYMVYRHKYPKAVKK